MSISYLRRGVTTSFLKYITKYRQSLYDHIQFRNITEAEKKF